MQLTTKQISVLLHGTLEGNPNTLINRLSKIEEATSGTLSFLANPKYEAYLYTTDASAVIVNQDFKESKPVHTTLIRVKDAYAAFALLLEKHGPKYNKSGIETPNFIHPSASIGNNVYIGAFVYIGPCVKIGDNCKIYPHSYLGDNVQIGHEVTIYSGVKIYCDCQIGSHVTLHAGSVIGSDGFGFAPDKNGKFTKISQVGNVVIEDDVEIGANTTIDRATMGSTIIRRGVKLDNLVQVAHNVVIGTNTAIAAQSGIAGSTKIGEDCLIGGQVGIAGHLTIASGSQIGAKSGLNFSLKEKNKRWNGIPAMNHRDSLRVQVINKHLPELEKRVRALERLVADLQKNQQKCA